MKDNIANVLEDFEKLAYKILMWVILVPKTIIKVVVDPGFVPEYVKGELNAEKGKQFDEYISPILLYLGVTLLPAVAIYLLPSFGIEMVSPHEDPQLGYDAYVVSDDGSYFSVNDPSFDNPALADVIEQSTNKSGATNKSGDFNAYDLFSHIIDTRVNMTTRANTSNQWHAFQWDIWACKNHDLNSEPCDDYVYYYGEIHDQQYGWTCIYGTLKIGNMSCLDSRSEKPLETDWLPPEIINGITYGVSITGSNSVSDTFYLGYRPVELPEPDPDTGSRYTSGQYKIDVSATTRSKEDPSVLVESESISAELSTIPYTFIETINAGSVPLWYSAEFIFTPQSVSDSNERRNILNYFSGLPSSRNQGEERKNLAERLESGETIGIGLALLLPPLLIAGAIGIFMGKKPSTGENVSEKPKSSIGEEALKDHFYQQCYYFTPVGLAFWAWYYSLNYYTYDIQYRVEWLWIPFALALIWFFVVEVLSIAEEIPSRSKKSAFFILFGCIAVMFLVIRLGIAFSYDYDELRKTAIWFYPGAGLFLTLGILYFQLIRRGRDKKAQK